MDDAGSPIDKSLALIVEKQVAQTARKHLEEHSYWDDTRRLTKLTNKHIAIPVTGQCGRALLSTEGNRNVSFLQSSDSDINGYDRSKMGVHQPEGIRQPTCLSQSSSRERGVKSFIGIVTNPKQCCITRENLVTTPTITSSREKSQEIESGARTNIGTSSDPPCCCDSPKKALPTSQNPSSSEGAQQAENGTHPLLSTPHNDASRTLFSDCGCNQSAISTHKDPEAIWYGQLSGFEAKLVQMDLPPSKKTRITTPYDRLRTVIEGWAKEGRIQWKEELAKEIPKNWERHGDLILLPSSCFQDPTWSTLPDLWSMVASSLNCRRVARRGRIRSDDFRSPRTEILLGTDRYVEHTDNGIHYTFDIRYSMFSSGNITEKLRIANLDCSQETVVDIYAGIGYFTLPYLVHAKAKLLYACEWNPHAVQALRKNLQLNSVNNRCVVLDGDNRKVCPKGVADRVNLGLIPSSEQGWPVACAALNPTTGGMLHIHGNVASYPKKEWTVPITTSCSQPDNSSSNELDGRYSPTELSTDSSGFESRLDTRLPNELSCLELDSRHTSDTTYNEKSPVQAQLPSSYQSNISQSHSSCQGWVEPEAILSSTIVPSNEAITHQQVTGAEDYAAMDSPIECSEAASMPTRERTKAQRQQVPQDLQPREMRDLLPVESRDSQPVAAKDTPQDADTVECTRKGREGSIQNAKPGNTRGTTPSSSNNNPNVNGCQTEEKSQPPNVGDSHSPNMGESHPSNKGVSQPHNEVMYNKKLFNDKHSGNSSEFKRKAWVDWACCAVKRINQILCELHENRWSVELVHIEHVKSYAPHIDHLVVDLKCRPIM